MNLKALLPALSLIALTSAPSMAHPLVPTHGVGHVTVHSTAVPIFCNNDDDFFDTGFSRFNHGVYQGGIFDWDGEDSVGFRIDTGAATSFSFDVVSTGDSEPIVNYVYTTNGSNFFRTQSGITATTSRGGVTHFSWNIRNSSVPSGARIVTIYFDDFGSGAFTDTASHAVVNGLGVGVDPHLESNCTID